MKIQIIFIHNPFRIKKPLTYLSALIRYFTGFKYNHVGLLINNNVIDMSTTLKFRTYEKWLEESDDRTFEISDEIDTIFNYSDSINLSRKLKGYDYIKLLNHLSKMKIDKIFLPENEKRMVCSEFVQYLITGQMVNWETPKSLYEKYMKK